jgi:hypothetical protein
MLHRASDMEDPLERPRPKENELNLFTQGRDQWRVLVNMIMNRRFPQKANFLAS